MKNWKHYIIDNDTGNYLSWNGTTVVSSSTPTEIMQGPIGWQDIEIRWERIWEKVGVIRNFTIPLNFIRDARQILRHELLTTNINRSLSLRIEKRRLVYTGTTWQHIYELFYQGELDFSSYNDNGVQFSLNVSEGGISKKLKANSNTPFALPMTARVVVVKMDGINIQYNIQATSFDQLYQSKTTNATNHKDTHSVNLTKTGGDDQTANVAVVDVIGEVVTGINFTNSSKWFLTVTDDVTLNLSLKFSFNITMTTNGTFKRASLWIFKSDGSLVYTLVDYSQGGGSHNQNYTVDHNMTVSMLKGQSLFLIADTEIKTPVGNVLEARTDLTVYESTIKINYFTKFRTTYVKAKLLSTVAKELTGKISGDEADIDTTFIQTQDNFVLLPGDSVRGIETAELKTTPDDYFQFTRVVLAAGMGIEGGKIVINDYDHFFPVTPTIQIPKIKGLEISDATEIRVSKVKIGYQPQDIGDVNGKLEFNNTHVYLTPDQSTNKELNLVSPYAAQPYAIEHLRIFGASTTDDKSDNTVFILNVEPDVTVFTETVLIDTFSGEGVFSIPNNADRDKFMSGIEFTVSGTTSNNGTFTVKRVDFVGGGYNVVVNEAVITETPTATFTLTIYNLKRETYDNALTDIGIPDPVGIFNIIGLTPKRLLEKHRKFIDSLMYQFDGDFLRFQTTDMNPLLKTVKGPVTVDEDADYTIGTTILFKPALLSLDAAEPVNLVAEMAANPNSPFEFGDNVIGFAGRLGMQPDVKNSQAYNLLAGPDTDIQNIFKDAYK